VAHRQSYPGTRLTVRHVMLQRISAQQRGRLKTSRMGWWGASAAAPSIQAGFALILLLAACSPELSNAQADCPIAFPRHDLEKIKSGVQRRKDPEAANH
jgi:hypothetical protein